MDNIFDPSNKDHRKIVLAWESNPETPTGNLRKIHDYIDHLEVENKALKDYLTPNQPPQSTRLVAVLCRQLKEWHIWTELIRGNSNVQMESLIHAWIEVCGTRYMMAIHTNDLRSYYLDGFIILGSVSTELIEMAYKRIMSKSI